MKQIHMSQRKKKHFKRNFNQYNLRELYKHIRTHTKWNSYPDDYENV